MTEEGESTFGFKAQVSLHPLRQEALQIFRDCALKVEPNAVSTLLVGDDATISAALQQAFCHAAEQGPMVMVVTLPNACPAPGKPKARSFS